MHTLAATVVLLGVPLRMHIIVNAYWEPLDFELPPPDNEAEAWRRCIDTSLDSPDDICAWADAPRLQALSYRAAHRSVVLLFAYSPPKEQPAIGSR